MTETSDAELLSAWVTQRREPAFHALVVRYAGLVHMASKRACGDDSLAADVSQLVFIQLAQKAKSLLGHPSLAGWLHVTAVMKTRELIGKNQRESRKLNRFHSAMEPESSTPQDGVWQEIQPHLNDALDSLSKNDREAILLRFYRSLSVKEIAATLGIANDAAQKRLDRATDRLREKLTRRGVTTSASLSAVMLAGFSTDAQAAVITTTVLSSKAIAASAVTPATGIFATILAMKATSYVAPAVILLCGGLFLNHQSQAISRIEKESAATPAAIDAHALQRVSVNSKAKPPAIVEQIKEGAIDWNQIAQKISRTSFDSWENKLILEQLRKRVQTLSREELVAACDSLAGLECPEELHVFLTDLIMAKLGEMDPAYVLDRFSGLADASNWSYRNALLKVFRKWALRDLEQASAWLDSTDTSGKFASPGVTGYTDTFRDYKGSIAKSLFAKDRIAGADYLRALPPELRNEIMGTMNLREFPLEVRVDYAALIRSLAPISDQPRLIAESAFENASGAPNGTGWAVKKEEFPQIAAYLKGISATDAERREVISHLSRLYSGDTDDAREWLKEQSPQDLDALTGVMLGSMGQGDFEEAAKIVRGYHDDGAGDDLITNFLHGIRAKDSPTARELVSRIKDPVVRERNLKNLKP